MGQSGRNRARKKSGERVSALWGKWGGGGGEEGGDAGQYNTLTDD